MAAPEYVPQPKDDHPRVYESPPWRAEPWFADRPGDLRGPQPHGPRLGYPGPDQGFALLLARRFEGRLVLGPGEDENDVIAGCVEIANKRASLAGRAPVIHDLTVAFTVWGYLAEADPELVRLRKRYFQAVANPLHYSERRRVVDVVPVAVLQMSPADLQKAVANDPRRERIFKRRSSSGSAPSSETPTDTAPAA
jgi:hypothetical protein